MGYPHIADGNFRCYIFPLIMFLQGKYSHLCFHWLNDMGMSVPLVGHNNRFQFVVVFAVDHVFH